jgi:hypothetical protein
VLTNTANPSTGIFLKDAFSTAVVVGSAISVPANANSYAINGAAYSYLFYKNLYFSIDTIGESTESKIANNVNKNLINSYDPVVYSIGDQTISGVKTFDVFPIVSGNKLITGVDLSSYATTANLASTGSTLTNSINSLSGTLTSTYATINNLASTGSTLQSNISSTGSSLDNKIGSLSGTLTSTYATIVNLSSTGSTLNTRINDLSGYVNTQDNSISSNLISTGNTLQNSINSLSGSSVLLYGNQSVGGVKTFRDNVYINNLFVTGTETIVNTPQINIASNYLLLNLTGGAVDGGIFFVTGVGLTGINDTGPIIGFDHSNKFKFGVSTRNSDLSTLPDIASVQDITTYSGFVDGKYSTIINLASTGSTLSTNLASTGSTLQTNINNLSNTYATITNLASTGSTLVTNLASTGSTLDTKINNLSGYVNSSSSNILFTTGNQIISGLKTFNTGLSTTYISGVSGISLNILGYSDSISAQTLRNINITAGLGTSTINAGDIILIGGNLSGVSPNILKTGASITIGGAKNTVSSPSTADITIKPSIDQNGAAGNIVLEAGASTTYNGKINMFGDININGTSDMGLALSSKNINIYRRGDFFGSPSQRLAVSIDNNNVNFQNGMGLQVSGAQVTPALYATSTNLASTGSTLVTNLASTGSTLNSSINSLSGTLTGNYLTTSSASSTYATITNLASTGSTLVNSIGSLSGTLTSNYSTITNLASTGSTLDTKINSLSGYINSSSSNIVFTTGNQTISGTKTFIQDTTFGDSAQGDFLVISGNNFTVYGSGNFTSGLFVNGNAVLTGVNLSSYATTVNLASTGSTLDTKINNLSGYVTGVTGTFGASVNSLSANSVFITGSQTISGNKTFRNTLSVATISGLSGVGSKTSIDIKAIDNALLAFTDNYLGGDISITAGSGNLAPGSINLYAGKQGNNSYYGNIAAIASTIEINNENTNGSRSVVIYKTGIIPTANVNIGQNSVAINNTFTISGVQVTPSLYATSTNLASTGSNLNTQIENAKKLALAYAIAL